MENKNITVNNQDSKNFFSVWFVIMVIILNLFVMFPSFMATAYSNNGNEALVPGLIFISSILITLTLVLSIFLKNIRKISIEIGIFFPVIVTLFIYGDMFISHFVK